MTHSPRDPDAEVIRPTVVEVSLERLAENYRAIRGAVAPAAVMPILKANAYGHGLVDVARHLVRLGATSLGVAFLEEAIALRRAGIAAPILVMGGIFGNQIPVFLRHGLADRQAPADRRRSAGPGRRGAGAPQDRHRDGTHRRPLLQRAGAPRARLGVPARRRGRRLLSFRQCRCRRPGLGAPAVGPVP